MILALTVAAGLPAGARPLAMGAVFGIGLVLVVFAGVELFTGYALYCTVGLARGFIALAGAIRLLGLVWIGNLAGALILVGLFAAGGGGGVFSTPDFLSGYVAHKADASPVAILARAVLCNWLVCLAIWNSARMQGDPAKVIVIAWCLLAFVAPGFERSVADMTAFGLGLAAPGAVLGLGLAVYDLIVATLGQRRRRQPVRCRRLPARRPAQGGQARPRQRLPSKEACSPDRPRPFLTRSAYCAAGKIGAGDGRGAGSRSAVAVVRRYFPRLPGRRRNGDAA